MIEFTNGGRLVTSADELPRPPSFIKRLYLDLETTSRDYSKNSLNPWRDCFALGIAVTWDDQQGSWYVPIDHEGPTPNIELRAVRSWLFDVLQAAEVWVNHNVKYDCHVMTNDLGFDFLRAPKGGRLSCTVVRSKIKDSDRVFRGGYGLDAVAKDWLREDIRHYEARLKPFLGKDNQDYGQIPSDICGEYACQDVLTNRRLDKLLLATIPEECHAVVDTEERLTSVLVRMEREGVRVDEQQLEIAEAISLHRMIQIEQKLNEVTGRLFDPASNKDCFDVLCNQYGLPVISWTESDDENVPEEDRGNPSFNAAALESYKQRVDAPREVLELMIEFRSHSTFRGLFAKTFRKLNVNGILHGTINQCVRTGRTSMSEPNLQQADKRAKQLILPPSGEAFLGADASQIEFRTIVHYTQDPECLKAYNENPDTDFHQWVADMCGMTRRPAKTVNFSIAFGQGKGKTVEQLSVNEDIVKVLEAQVANLPEQERQAAFRSLCKQKGEAAYDEYHARLPGIKRTSKAAGRTCRYRGYVRNVRGRRRHLPMDKSHLAFSTLNQSSAADIVKERMVALDEMLRGTPIRMWGLVHDFLGMTGPVEAIEDPRTARDIVALLEENAVGLRVPIRWQYNTSRVNWRECDPCKNLPQADKAEAQHLEHLR